MKHSKYNVTASHGAGGHYFVTSGSGVPATQRYTSIFGWGGSVAVTYDQVLPGGTISSETATIAQDSGIYGVLQNVVVTNGGILIAYREAE